MREPNILLVVIDTLRADRLGCYGNTHGLTPFLDSLAARGYVFRNAYAQSSWTHPSIASLLTSRFQSQHGIVWFDSVISPNEVTLPEALKEAGYVTGGFSANGVIAKERGFGQGFDEYRAPSPVGKGRGEVVNRQAVAWLDGMRAGDRASAPVFLYVHYMEPHTPYAPPRPFLDRVLVGQGRPDMARVMEAWNLARAEAPPTETRRIIEAVYDAEVMAADDLVRSLFLGLESRGFLDDAVVVVTADHGEEFWDHGGIGHSHTLFNELIHVPLIAVTRGRQARAVPAAVDDIVSLIDVAPTLIDFVGSHPPSSWEGRSWKGTLIDRRWWRIGNLSRWLRAETAYSERLPRVPILTDHAGHERAIVTPMWKVIATGDGERRFYDLRVDPQEREQREPHEPEQSGLQRALDRAIEQAARNPAPRDVVQLNEEITRKLRALGYVN